MSVNKDQNRLVIIDLDTNNFMLSNRIKTIAKGIEDAYLELGAVPGDDYTYKDLIDAAVLIETSVDRPNAHKYRIINIENEIGSVDHKV